MRSYKSGNLDPKARVMLTLQTDIVVISLEPEEPGALELGAASWEDRMGRLLVEDQAWVRHPSRTPLQGPQEELKG